MLLKMLEKENSRKHDLNKTHSDDAESEGCKKAYNEQIEHRFEWGCEKPKRCSNPFEMVSNKNLPELQ